jgi:alanine dehydrogenase
VWSRQDQVELYLSQPELFESNLDQVLPYISILTNCILWSPRYPRTLTRAIMEAQFAHGSPLRVIGDITCDPEGSIEFSKETWIDAPTFIYHPARKTSELGMEGEGVAVMAVTNLPCELSADSSDQFSRELSPLLDSLVNARLDAGLEEAGLPESLVRATILWKGEFTSRFSYMEEFVQPEAPAEVLFPVTGTHME